MHQPANTSSQKQISAAFILNTCFVLVEIVGGLFTNSVAILSDALHDLGDSIALGAAWYFERLSRRERTPGHTYGFTRYSVLGAVLNAVVLITGSVFIIREAILRLHDPEPIKSSTVIGLAVLGIVVNAVAFSRMHKGHSHNVEVVRLHLLEDVMGWGAVLLGAIAIKLWGIHILDPILSIVISIWILIQVIRRLTGSLRIMLQIAPPGISTEAVEAMIRQQSGVLNTHDMHIWTMDGSYHILTIHVVVDQAHNMTDLANLKTRIREKLNTMQIPHATIEFEYPDEPCIYDD